MLEETNFVSFTKRHTVVADQRVSDGQNLTLVRRICKRFRIADHTSVEDDLSLGRAVGTKGGTREGGSVFKDQVALQKNKLAKRRIKAKELKINVCDSKTVVYRFAVTILSLGGV